MNYSSSKESHKCARFLEVLRRLWAFRSDRSSAGSTLLSYYRLYEIRVSYNINIPKEVTANVPPLWCKCKVTHGLPYLNTYYSQHNNKGPWAVLMKNSKKKLFSTLLSYYRLYEMSGGMWFPTMWHFDKWGFRRACAASWLAKKIQMVFSQ